MDYYISVLKKYAVFEGRARRKEYWMFALFNMIIALIFQLLMLATLKIHALTMLFLILYWIYGLAVIVPSLAVVWRRLHDIGKSGGWFFISLIPLVGAIILLVFLCTDSQPGENQYGPNPKGISMVSNQNQSL